MGSTKKVEKKLVTFQPLREKFEYVRFGNFLLMEEYFEGRRIGLVRLLVET